MTRRHGFIGFVVVTAVLCWAGTALAQPFPGGLPQCRKQLAACQAGAQAFPATGQTTCWNTAGAVISCTGTVQDGDIQAGALLSYTDNGDGTITDNNTGLVWEKKSLDGTIHDQNTIHTWTDAVAVHVAGLNTIAFAGHTDWRLPNVRELQSIQNYEKFGPAVSSVFNTGCVAGCATLACSCTASSNYWSSISFAPDPAFAWFVDFSGATLNRDGKIQANRVRAVRGGLNLGSSQ
jgi:hypothetical protein